MKMWIKTKSWIVLKNKLTKATLCAWLRSEKLAVFFACTTFVILIVWLGKIGQTPIYNHSELLQDTAMFGTQKYVKIQEKEVAEVMNADLNKRSLALVKRMDTNRKSSLLGEKEAMVTEKVAIQLFKSKKVVGNLIQYEKKNYTIKKVLTDAQFEIYVNEPLQTNQPITLYTTSNSLSEHQINYLFLEKIVFFLFGSYILGAIVRKKKILLCLIFVLGFGLFWSYLPNQLADYDSWVQLFGHIRETGHNLFYFGKTAFDFSVLRLFEIAFLLFGVHLFFAWRGKLSQRVRGLVLRKREEIFLFILSKKR